MLRSCSHFPQRCELPAECQPRSSSGDSGTWSEGDSPLPLQSRGGAPLLPQVVPARQVRVLPLHTERGAVDQDLQCYRDSRWRECQSIFFSFFGFLCTHDINWLWKVLFTFQSALFLVFEKFIEIRGIALSN